MEREKKVRNFLRERFGRYHDEIKADDSLEAVIDSMGLFDLLAFLEEEFSMQIPNEEFSPTLFNTISNMLKTVEEFSEGNSP